jgi:hypothetical protein
MFPPSVIGGVRPNSTDYWLLKIKIKIKIYIFSIKKEPLS